MIVKFLIKPIPKKLIDRKALKCYNNLVKGETNMTINFVLVNNHFYDQQIFAKFNDVLYYSWYDLTTAMGAEYQDLASPLWDNVTFIYEGVTINKEEAFDIF